MVTSRVSLVAFALAACLPVFSPTSYAALPDYRIGDIVREDIVTSAPLPSAKSFASEAARQIAAPDTPLVVRFNPKSPDEAEISLRAAIIMARYNFLRVFQEQLLGRKPTEADLGSPAYTRAIAEVSRISSAPHFPFDQLAPLWVSGQSEETLVLTLAQPIRQTMANIIVDDKNARALPPNKSLRLLTVKNLTMPLGIRDLDGPGLIVSQNKILSLSQARKMVENNFPATQPGLARFAATFIRPNTQPDTAATILLQSRPQPETAANASARSVEVILRKGQIVDRQALDTLAALREKFPGALLEQPAPSPQPSSPRPSSPARSSEPAFRFPVPNWTLITAVSGSLIGLAGIFWLKRARKTTTRRRRGAVVHRPARDEFTLVDDSVEPVRQRRTQPAKAGTARTHEALRAGVLTWLKDKFVHTLFRHRAELLAAQQKAQAEMEQLERRLEQLHAPLQQRIQAYEKRIAELEEKLASKGEENRHLLGARITLARQQLERSRFESN